MSVFCVNCEQHLVKSIEVQY